MNHHGADSGPSVSLLMVLVIPYEVLTQSRGLLCNVLVRLSKQVYLEIELLILPTVLWGLCCWLPSALQSEISNVILIHDHHDISPRDRSGVRSPSIASHICEDLWRCIFCASVIILNVITCVIITVSTIFHSKCQLGDFALSPLLPGREERKLIITPVFSENQLNQEN